MQRCGSVRIHDGDMIRQPVIAEDDGMFDGGDGVPGVGAGRGLSRTGGGSVDETGAKLLRGFRHSPATRQHDGRCLCRDWCANDGHPGVVGVFQPILVGEFSEAEIAPLRTPGVLNDKAVPVVADQGEGVASVRFDARLSWDGRQRFQVISNGVPALMDIR